MPYFALFYETTDDFITRRTPYRADHLKLAQEAHDRGELLLAGAFADSAEGALLIFRAPDRSVAVDFAGRDPYVREGLVTRWYVRPWTQVIGDGPDDPVKAGRR